jgi:hypothetical protein
VFCGKSATLIFRYMFSGSRYVTKSIAVLERLLPHPCQGWGRGFESLRPLQFLSRFQKLIIGLGSSRFHFFGLATTAAEASAGVFHRFRPGSGPGRNDEFDDRRCQQGEISKVLSNVSQVPHLRLRSGYSRIRFPDVSPDDRHRGTTSPCMRGPANLAARAPNVWHPVHIQNPVLVTKCQFDSDRSHHHL